MKDLYVVSKFTIKDMIKRKSFIVSNILILLFIIIACNIPNIIKLIKGDDTLSKSLIVDNDNIYEGILSDLNSMNLGYNFIVDNNNLSMEDIKKKVTDGDVDEAIVVSRDNGQLKIDYVVDNASFYGSVPSDLINVFDSLYYELQVSKLELTEEEYNKIHEKIEYNLVQSTDEEVNGSPLIVMFASIILFFGIYFYAFQVSSSITTEKTSKIIETLVTSTKPSTIVLGKTLGIGLVGLAQLALDIIVAIIGFKVFMDASILEGIVDLSAINAKFIIITLIYFILGYFVYALLYALVGSTVAKPEDIQSANTPVSFISMAGFYLAYFTMMNPTSELNKISALVPISSPFSMPFRIFMGIASTTDIILSIVLLIAFILLTAYISIKIYSQAILNYGNKLSFKDLITMFKNKNI